MAETLGADREAAVCRELTKRFEQIVSGTLRDLCDGLTHAPDRSRGEFVVIVGGHPAADDWQRNEQRLLEILPLLLSDLSLKRAVTIAAKLVDVPKNRIYEKALELREDQ